MFFKDPISNKTKTWEDLISDLNSMKSYSNVVYGGDFYGILLQIVANILYGGRLQMKLDASFQPDTLSTNVDFAIASREDLIEHLKQGRSAQFLLYTTGTTGTPKEVVQDIEILRNQLKQSPNHRDDVWALCYHPCHIAGLQVILQALFNGNTLVRLKDLDFRGMNEVLSEFGVTHISATPSFYRLMNLKSSHPKVKRLTSGGERFDEVLMNGLKKTFPNAEILNIYAATEFGSLLFSKDQVFTIPEQKADRLKIEDGSLWVSVDGQWHETGDQIEWLSQDEGRFTFIGRSDDQVNIGGHKVNMAFIEDKIRAVDGVSWVKVRTRKNSVTGQILCAEIVSELNEQQLRAQLRGELSEWMIPRMITHIETPSLTVTGKAI